MPSWSLFADSKDEDDGLTPAQRYMYATEKGIHFRTMFKFCATQSERTLGPDDLMPASFVTEIAGIGQFAEGAYPLYPPEYIFGNLDLLMKTDFPLEGYDAFPGTKLVSGFKGSVADAAGYVAYRTNTQQLVVAFAGATSITHVMHNIHVSKRKHPAGKGCSVHAGIWSVYSGMRTIARELMVKGLQENDVREVVITGHSMGGALASLFAFDVLDMEGITAKGTSLLILLYGSPRVANAVLADHYRARVAAYEAVHGEGTVREYLVKAYNDGVPSFPPTWLGFRHMTNSQLFYYCGCLLRIPQTESEHGQFTVSKDALDLTKIPDHPRGGHGYYNGRDIEKVVRRVLLFKKMMDSGAPDWEKDYLIHIAKIEREWQQQEG
ncbi:alpha/beta-hydrolase [Obba rivulosa]|uniref:Alpha/beta-hydrolase n=1 Tax=Obba rivulosa TaxID=1052685 RepID=A0A8E2DV15_9APHY|nr:alpha/beta-hydrolase [Obba rivulosa]